MAPYGSLGLKVGDFPAHSGANGATWSQSTSESRCRSPPRCHGTSSWSLIPGPLISRRRQLQNIWVMFSMPFHLIAQTTTTKGCTSGCWIDHPGCGADPIKMEMGSATRMLSLTTWHCPMIQWKKKKKTKTTESSQSHAAFFWIYPSTWAYHKWGYIVDSYG